uniref:Ras protein specific guanine nucleotide releasing factor 2 n=1 Tax=Cyanoderma ruficeps TaxID=181631 RepID=A0A8C3QSM7_9PASS
MQKSVRYNEGHALYLALLARKEGTKRGYLSKKTAETNRWHEKWFALYQNVLFYFEGEQSARPAGMYMLEGCNCERVPAPKGCAAGSAKDAALDKQHYFTVLFGHEGQKPLELRCEDEVDGDEWVEAIHQASYSDILIEREVLMQKYIHLVQIVETEKVAANQLRHQLEDQDTEIERLKSEIVALNKTKEKMRPYQGNQEDEDPDIKKIKKVQSFMRGWLCRRKWKTIVQDYICSPHAESMRKRNQIVFNMVEAESEYVHQLYVLVNCFLRPLRMAASSKKPPISHDDVSSIFLNSETIMFLHEIFHQGLKARIANWPTLILADLFDILLPMLNIYQEFVRNHQYSLQVDFDKLLKQYEANPACEGRMLETFLTYPMFQIPRYIITLHELLAHTPHEHVERKSLEFAKSKLEELSRVMHDEVSDTENIRKNLAIERTIVEGCDILLDTSQTFIRQGSLIQVPSVERGKLSKVRLGSLSLKKEGERQCFLFTKHFLICTRSSGGKLHLLKTGGVLSLIECTLVEETEATKGSGQVFGHLDFKLIVEPTDAPPFTVVLLAPSRQEKAAWTSDISQCIDNIRCNGLMTIVFEENSKVTVPHMIKSDARLHRDDIDICFSKTLNSCKVPQIRYASVERLLERLTDLRFLSIDFLNTFLHTYRIFTTAAVVLEKLSDIYRRPFTSIPVRCARGSLELFFATSQNNRGEYLADGKSPHLCRKFSSPPPLSLSRTSSPARTRKLSLTSPLNSRIGALDLSASSVASSPTSNYSPATSPPPTGSKAPLDLSRGLSSPEQSPGSAEDSLENPRLDLCNNPFDAGDDSLLGLSAPGLSLPYLQQLSVVENGRTHPATECPLEDSHHWAGFCLLFSLPSMSREFLGQGWMKVDKNERTPYIMKTSQHFNDMSNLVASQIMSYADVPSRASAIEKWVAVADICRCLHNYNGVLEITSALNRSAIYRLKKTWAKVSKQTKALMDKLQKTVSSEGRFKNLREMLKNCNPPAVPYLGMYLTDLAFIEEGTPNFTEEGLVNFSKMRMISHIIREIRQFQQTSYRIEHQQKVTHYLLDKTLIIDEDTLYELSLKIEPRLPA